ncbi:MAG TPA: hypothetical protein IAB55_06620 [Candidatus Merdivicinus faecavium]|nr:hypothetical protein [Candidatus Merdivicinus faecavium]
MYHTDEFALNAAKEVTLEALKQSPVSMDKGGAELVGEFFQTVFEKIHEVSQKYESGRR